MIIAQVSKMIDLSIKLKETIILDIEDVKNAEHEKLLERNNSKLELMQEISNSHEELNNLLAECINNGEDVNDYKEIISSLENHLHELYELNGKLASIVLPVKQMYKEIIDEITKNNGGSLIEVNA